MENAVKALLIAGGVLFAILIVSIMMYMSNSITEMGKARENKKAAEQLIEFNLQYEAYNKKLMYGTDVITAVNKAIQFNGGLNAEEKEDFIDVELVLIQDFVGVKVDANGNVDRGNYTAELGSQQSLANKKYTLRQDETTTKMNQNVIEFFFSVSDSKKVGEGKEAVYYYDAITDFKRAIFECSKFEYNPDTGKVNFIEFTQRNMGTY